MIRTVFAATSVLMLSATASAVPITPADVGAVLSANDVLDVEIDPIEAGSDFAIGSGTVDLGGSTVNFTTRIMRCDDGITCKTVLMFANFALGRPARPGDYEAVNSYNDTYPFGRAYVYVDENGDASVGVDYVVDLEDENVFGANEVSTFGIILSSFLDQMATTDVGE